MVGSNWPKRHISTNDYDLYVYKIGKKVNI